MAHSRFLFRPRQVVRNRSAARSVAWVGGAIAALLALLAWGEAIDAVAGLQQPARPQVACRPGGAQ